MRLKVYGVKVVAVCLGCRWRRRIVTVKTYRWCDAHRASCRAGMAFFVSGRPKPRPRALGEWIVAGWSSESAYQRARQRAMDGRRGMNEYTPEEKGA